MHISHECEHLNNLQPAYKLSININLAKTFMRILPQFIVVVVYIQAHKPHTGFSVSFC